MFLSFIIPVYNTKAFLDECLQSLLDQDISQEEYEIICINDGSTDGSLEILRAYERAYTNIRVIDQKNSGVCTARNAGLRAACGDYIWYVDADDFIQKNYLGVLRQYLEQNDADRLIVDNFEYLPGSTSHMRVNTSWENSVVWRSVFRREFLLSNNLWFHYPELNFGEDALYMYEVRRVYPVTAELSVPIYYHRIRPDSLTTAINPATEAKRLRCNIREAQIVKGYYEKKDGILTEETANRLMSFLWGSLFRIHMLPKEEAKCYLTELEKKGLFPYHRPKECTIKKCPEINRTDMVGKLIDTIYINLHRPWGFAAMTMLRKLIEAKHKLMK